MPLSGKSASGDGRRLQFPLELGLNAAIAGYYAVPVIMLSGHAAACAQARTILGDSLVTVRVKEALSRTAAKLLPLVESRRRLQEAAREALAARDGRKPFRFDPPCRFSVTFQNSAQAEQGAMLPGVTRTSARTLTFSTQDYLEGVKTGRALIALALAR